VTVWRPLAGGMQALAGPDAGVLLKDPLVEEWTANEGVDPQERADEIRRLTVRSSRCLHSFCSVPACQAERYRVCGCYFAFWRKRYFAVPSAQEDRA